MTERGIQLPLDVQIEGPASPTADGFSAHETGRPDRQRSERNELIFALHSFGFSLRQIARIVGLSPSGVQYVLRPDLRKQKSKKYAREYTREYRKKHPKREKIRKARERERMRERRRNDPDFRERERKANRRRMRERYRSDPDYRARERERMRARGAVAYHRNRNETIRQLVNRDGANCYECGGFLELAEVHIDHIRPLSRGGSNDLANLQLLHPGCNMRKGSRWQAQ